VYSPGRLFHDDKYKRMPFFLIFFFLSLIFVLIPENAYAWGPATHLYFGVEVLKDVSVLSPVVASILSRYPQDFLYGCISADITVGKKYVAYRNHCHNWRIGLKILDQAQSVPQKAFALGYLSHLAADTVAHNFFVPSQILSSYSRSALGHTYWEIRADSLIKRRYWKKVRRITKDVQFTHDRLIRNIVEPTLFPFEVNKTIFNSILVIQRIKQWRQLVVRIASRSRYTLGLDEIEKYHRLSKLCIMDFLISFQDAECMKLDPTGRANWARARQIRRSLKRVARGRPLSQSDHRAVVRQLPVQAPPFD
jgi:hypothetical protein